MKFLLKQLRIGFPFVFPMCWLSPGEGDDFVVQETVRLRKQIENLEARVKELEEKTKPRARKEEPLYEEGELDFRDYLGL